MPHVVVGRASRSSLASADIDSHTICLRGKATTAATALHEVARAHISVEYAAMLYGVYKGVGLEMSPWPASASQR